MMGDDRTFVGTGAALVLACIAASVAPAACVGDLGDAGDGSGSDIDGPDPTELTAPDCSDVGPRMIRRLTNVQLYNTMVDLFGDPNVPVTDILTDPVILGFKVDATEAVIRDLNAQQLMSQAERIAEWAVAEKLGEISPCQSMDDNCYQSFIDSFGRRVYRGPVPDSSVAAYQAMFHDEPTFQDGAQAVIAAMLQSPHLLYRQERGAQDPDHEGRYQLTPYELASNISYSFTDAPPDATLMSAAESGSLQAPEDIEREVLRLISGSGSDAVLGHFVEGWVEIDDLTTKMKADPTAQYTPEIGALMAEETRVFFQDTVRSGGSFSDLLTAPHSMVNDQLAGYYGVPGPGSTSMEPTDITSSRGKGLLGQGSFLVRHALLDSSSPVQRGVVVRERFLCQHLPDPPPSVDTTLGEASDALTTRERYMEHMENDSCNGCHAMIDPVGFAFEHFDAFGRYRDQENGIPIDASGWVSGVSEGEVPLDGVDSLSDYLASSEEVAGCFERFASYYVYGLDGCNPEAIAELTAGEASISNIFVAIALAPHFSERRVE